MTTEFNDWRQYQDETAAFFREQGCSAEVEAKVQGVRAEHEIDVWVTFERLGIECKWAVECKLWNSRVPKEKVLAVKAIVDDVGADKGLIISEKGFQSGAYDATQGSNIALITSLDEFKKTVKTNLDSSSLIESDQSPSTLARMYCFPSENKPHTLLFQDDILFVGNWGGRNIALVDPPTKMILDVIELDNYEFIRADSKSQHRREIRRYPPGSMTVADGKLFVAQVFSEFILAVDIETRAIVKRIPIPGGGEGEFTLSPDGRKVYFSSNKVPKFFIIDSVTYDVEGVAYPGNGRGSLSILAHPSGEKLYIGIQRGGELNGVSYPGGNSFLAVYDLQNRRYESNIYLAEITNQQSDDSTPICVTYDSRYDYLYVGMFQSRRGIYRINAESNQIVDNIPFEPNASCKHFAWVDPLAQAIYEDYLLSVNRNNHELAVLDRASAALKKSIPLGEAPNGPRDIVVVRQEAVISYPERNGLIFVDLVEALCLLWA